MGPYGIVHRGKYMILIANRSSYVADEYFYPPLVGSVVWAKAQRKVPKGKCTEFDHICVYIDFFLSVSFLQVVC
jgi:hypothetical protein